MHAGDSTAARNIKQRRSAHHSASRRIAVMRCEAIIFEKAGTEIAGCGCKRVPLTRMATLKPKPKTFRLPPELEPLVEERMETEGYRSLSDYILALTLYDCWCERPHAVTAPLFAKPQKVRDQMVSQIVEEFKTKRKTGRASQDSFFERRVRQIAEERAKKKPDESDG